MYEHAIRGSFSLLAAAVTLAMSQEWITFAHDEHNYWKLVPAFVLALFSLYECHKVWTRVENILGLTL